MILPASLAFRSSTVAATACFLSRTASINRNLHTRLMSTSKPYAVNAVFSIKEDRREDFIKVILNDQKQSLATEDGIIRFVVGEDKDKKNTFYLHEEYIDEDAFKKHIEMPHWKSWDEFTKTEPWTEGGEPVAGFYHCTHEAGKKEPIRSGHALNAVFTVKADRRDEFLKIIKEDQEKTLSDEKGSIQFVVGEDKEKENTFYLFEQYVDEEAFNAHNDMPHFKPWGEFTKTDPFTEDGGPVAGFYNTLPIEEAAAEDSKRKEDEEPKKDAEEPDEKKQKTSEE